MERIERRFKNDGRVPLIYDSAREKSEALLSITVDAPDALWVALESTTSTLIYPGPRANIRGEIDEGTSPTAARPWGSRVRSRALFFFCRQSIEAAGCVIVAPCLISPRADVTVED